MPGLFLVAFVDECEHKLSGVHGTLLGVAYHWKRRALPEHGTRSE
jgi:hypothetical protein